LHGSFGNMTLSWGGAYSLSDLLQSGRLLRLLVEARAVATTTNRSLAAVLGNQAIMPNLPASVHRMIARLRGYDPGDVSRFSLLRHDVIDDFSLKEQWHQNGFDPAFRLRRTSGAQWRAALLFDRNQAIRDHWQMLGTASDLNLRDPFHDRDLIEFCLRVPETLYRRNGVKRWFARQVLADRLPPEILNETKRGEQAPNWFESLDARKADFSEEVGRLEGSRLANRLIDIPRLKRLIEEWPKDAREAQTRENEYRFALDRAVHLGKFIRWVEGGNS